MSTSTPTQKPTEAPEKGNESVKEEKVSSGEGFQANSNATAKSESSEGEKENNGASSSAAAIYCTCRHATLCNKCGIPMSSKDATKRAIAALIEDERPAFVSVFGNGPLLVSNIPKSSMTENSEVSLGIDEAGRGCVLGPMVYGCAYWSMNVDNSIPKGFRDSKQMKEEERTRIFEELKEHPEIGYALRSILPSEISRNMLRTPTDVYNLNQMSHDATIILIRKIVDMGDVKVKKAYIDTVGNPQSYQRKLEREFPNIEFVVESKADANYAPCSAASVVAKVMRDRMLESWKYSESSDITHDFGSGYPSDPKCKSWMEQLPDPVFGYPDIMRFSWAPSKKQLNQNGVPVVFHADLDDEGEFDQKKGMSQFLQKKRKRLGYFEKRNIGVKKFLME